MTDRLTKWHYPPDDPGFWERKKMPQRTYVVKLSVRIEVAADSRDDADVRAIELLRAAIAMWPITDIETEEVEEL